MTRPLSDPPDHSSENDARFRWSSLFQQTAEPVFLLNRRRQVLFVNRAWETLTGLTLAEVKGQVCRRRPRGILAEKVEIILGALAPPPEVLQGHPGQARRLLPGRGAEPASWQVAFFPLVAGPGLRAILGKIDVLPRLVPAPSRPLPEKILALRERHAQRFRLDQLPGEVPPMARLQEQIRLAAQTRLPVTLVGPPGTGKHWCARAIHQLSPEREKVFVYVDAARLPADAIADFLFGPDERQRSLCGCVYLREPHALPRELQDRLAQHLQAHEEIAAVPRLLAGFRADPRDFVQAGLLLPELYCRLSALVLTLPPLQERMQDFSWWMERLLARACTAAERSLAGPSPEALELLRTHPWPGNLQELYEVLLGACLRAKGQRLEASDLPFHLRHAPLPPEKPVPLDQVLEQVERRLIVQALRLAQNNKTRAAELLAIWRPRLLRRLENLGIEEPKGS